MAGDETLVLQQPEALGQHLGGDTFNAAVKRTETHRAFVRQNPNQEDGPRPGQHPQQAVQWGIGVIGRTQALLLTKFRYGFHT